MPKTHSDPGRRHGRWISSALCAAMISLTIGGCSKPRSAEETKGADATKGAEVQQAQAPTPPTPDDDIPPVVRTPWKGDLNEIVKRRAVRVLVPFRRPEFFYMEGRPAGILVEAFRELERTFNTRYKTGAADHIVVALLPTPIDKLRE